MEKDQNKNRSIPLSITLLLMLLFNTLGNGSLFCAADSGIDGIARSPWTHAYGAITESEWSRMAGILREDPELDELLEAATHRLGLESVQDLSQVLMICTSLEGGTAGSYRNKEGNVGVIKIQETEGSAEKVNFGDRGKELLNSSIASKVISTPVRFVLKTEQRPEICVKPGLSVLDAYTVLAHELTHFIRDIALDDEDILAYSGPEDYVRREIATPWGELEAYSAQARALIRLKERSKSVGMAYQGELLQYFDEAGNLVDRQGLTDYILSDLGYKTNLREKYLDKLRWQHQNTVNELNLHENTYRSRIMESIEKLTTHLQQLRTWKTSISSNETAALREADARIAKAASSLDYQKNLLTRTDAEVLRLNARLLEFRKKAASLGVRLD